MGTDCAQKPSRGKGERPVTAMCAAPPPGALLALLGGASPSRGVLSDSTVAGLVALAGLLILIVVILRRSTSSPGRSVPARGSPDCRRRTAEPVLRGEAERLLVDLQEFGREIEGRLETRIRHLGGLLAEADKVREHLTAAVTEAREVLEGLRSKKDAGPQKGEPGGTDLKEQIAQLNSQGLSPGEIAQALGVPKGEVELIVGLQKRCDETPPS